MATPGWPPASAELHSTRDARRPAENRALAARVRERSRAASLATVTGRAAIAAGPGCDPDDEHRPNAADLGLSRRM